MAKLSSVRSDPDLESKGVWCTFEGSMKFLIARSGNPAYNERLRRLREPLIQNIRARDIDPEKIEAVVRECIAHHVLLDWQNVEDDKGEPIRYTPEVGLKVLADPAYRDVYQFVKNMADNSALFRKAVVEVSLGN
jgi:hypothetical protein